MYYLTEGLYLSSLIFIETNIYIAIHCILVESKRILHCDISWANILINHTHFKGLADDIHDFNFERIMSHVSFFSSLIIHKFLGSQGC